MANRNNKRKPVRTFNQTRLVNKHVGKSGQLKIKRKSVSKSERTLIENSCTHYRIKKGGRVVPAVMDNGDDTVTCKICGERFSATSASKSELKDHVKALRGQANLLMWAMQSGGGDQKTMDYLVQMKIMLKSFPKTSKNITKMFLRTTNAKKKQRDNNYRNVRNYGHWETR